MLKPHMVANSHSSKSNQLMEKLDERSTVIPDYMKAQILQGRNVVSIKEEIESQLNSLKQKKSKYLRKLIHTYLNDSLDWHDASDSILLLLQEYGDLDSKYELAMLYLERDEFENGEQVLGEIPTTYNLDQEQQLAHQYWKDFYFLLNDIQNSNFSIFQLTETHKQILDNIIVNDNNVASAWARDYLVSMGELEYEEPIQIANTEKSSKINQEYVDLLNTQPPSRLSIYPNPSKGYVIISYTLEMHQEGLIVIRDMKNNLIKSINVFNEKDEVVVEVENWKPGTYITTLKIGNKQLESTKFTVIN